MCAWWTLAKRRCVKAGVKGRDVLFFGLVLVQWLVGWLVGCVFDGCVVRCGVCCWLSRCCESGCVDGCVCVLVVERGRVIGWSFLRKRKIVFPLGWLLMHLV